MGEKIKARLKYFFLSFFSDKTAKEAPSFGFFWVVLGLFLSFVLIMLGYYGSGVAPFSSHYDNAGRYTEFIDNAFSAERISIDMRDHTAHSGATVNTYASEEDRAMYALNGYDLIVDTRPSDMPIEFAVTATKGEERISYAAYRALADADKKSYALEVAYTDVELEITPELIAEYESFLGGEEGAQTEFAALDKSSSGYPEALYSLYVKRYYPSVGSILKGSGVPVLRDYYYRNYITNGKAYYFYVFDDMCAGSFATDDGIPFVFGGYYGSVGDGRVGDIHEFVKQIYYDTASSTFSSYFLGMVTQLPALVFIPIGVALLMWLIGKAVKGCWVKTFGGCHKIVGSFVWMSSALTALAVFVGGWLTAARTMYLLIPPLFGGILLLRTAVFCTVSAIKNKRSTVKVGEKMYDIFGGIS